LLVVDQTQSLRLLQVSLFVIVLQPSKRGRFKGVKSIEQLLLVVDQTQPMRLLQVSLFLIVLHANDGRGLKKTEQLLLVVDQTQSSLALQLLEFEIAAQDDVPGSGGETGGLGPQR
jgi:hypothetical protein